MGFQKNIVSKIPTLGSECVSGSLPKTFALERAHRFTNPTIDVLASIRRRQKHI